MQKKKKVKSRALYDDSQIQNNFPFECENGS